MIKIINETRAISLVKYYATVFSGVIAALLISGFVSQAFAADLQASLIPDRDRSEASYIGVRTITLRYPEGSPIAQELSGKTERIQFSVNATANGETANPVIEAINRALVEAQSPVQVSEAVLSYTAVLRGGETSTILSYKTEIEPTLEGFVLVRGEGTEGHTIDLEWRGITVEGPVVVTSPENGEIDVNQPVGLLQATFPDIAEQLINSPAREIMEDPILKFEEFDTPMGTWHRLFDPVGTYGVSAGLDTGGAKALSVYSLGESSIREGAHTVEEEDATATIDGTEVRVHSQNPPPSGQITIAGYSNHQEREGTEFATVTADAPEGVQTSTGGFPIQVLLIFGGMMGAIAVFILFKARK